MRIAMLSDASVVHTQRWGDALCERGHTVELISLESGLESGLDYAFPCTRLRSGVPWRFLRYPLATGRVRRFLERFQPDLVNAHFVPNYGLIGVLAGRRPLAVSVWGSDVFISGRRSLLHRLRARYVLGRADAITTDADMLTRAVVELGGAADRTLTVPMGVDLELFRQRRRPPEEIGPVVVSTRKLEPVYNLAHLMRAIPLVLRRLPAARFVIVGDGPERAELAAQVADEGGAVTFRGMIPHAEMATVLGEGAVYVSTSLSDSTSVSLLEAMASGAFPIVTDIEANHEWIEDGVNGFLVPVDDAARLADRLAVALDDAALRARARIENEKRIRRRASWTDNMDTVAEFFTRLVESHTERKR